MELLVVISIIGILAAMLLPALARAKVAAQVKKAQIEEGQIINAVNLYESAYSRLPVSTPALNEAGTRNEDFTYGNTGLTGPAFKNQITDDATKTPASILAWDSSKSQPFSYQTNNSEVMAILLDRETIPLTGAFTINQGHVKNTQKTQFMNATLVSDQVSPGIGSDLVFRDPWGNPYIISFDLNNDEKTRDGLYRKAAMSQQNGRQGYYGLANSQPNPASDFFEGNSHVMVWSAGPDRRIHSGLPANAGANKDNVLSWKP